MGSEVSWSQPVCTECWVQDNTTTDGDDMKVRVPARVRSDDWLESLTICCQCGRLTTSGIFIRIDPATVPFPQKEKE